MYYLLAKTQHTLQNMYKQKILILELSKYSHLRYTFNNVQINFILNTVVNMIPQCHISLVCSRSQNFIHAINTIRVWAYLKIHDPLCIKLNHIWQCIIHNLQFKINTKFCFSGAFLNKQIIVGVAELILVYYLNSSPILKECIHYIST